MVKEKILFQSQPNQVRNAPREHFIEIGVFWKDGILASLVHMPIEELKLTHPPCGQRLLRRAFCLSPEFGEVHEQNDISPLL